MATVAHGLSGNPHFIKQHQNSADRCRLDWLQRLTSYKGNPKWTWKRAHWRPITTLKTKRKYNGVKARCMASPVFVWGDHWRWTGWQTGSVHPQYQQEQRCTPVSVQVCLQALRGRLWPSTQQGQKPARTKAFKRHSRVVTQDCPAPLTQAF